MRLLKYLINCGLGSRKVIINKVRAGEISVNGEIVFDERIDFYEGDEVLHLGNKLSEKKLKYYAFHKTMGYITAMKDDNRATIIDTLPDWFDKDSFFPIGRLDKDTEGVLIFTNDGDINRQMTEPRSGTEKKYYVELRDCIEENSLIKLRNGIEIQEHKCLPAKAEKIDDKSIILTIVEGKFHQVKRMMRAVGNEVTYLKRVQFGKMKLGDLKKGELKEVHLTELI